MKTVTIWMGQIRKLFCGALYRKRSGILIVPDQRYQFLDQHDVMAENSAAVGQKQPVAYVRWADCFRLTTDIGTLIKTVAGR